MKILIVHLAPIESSNSAVMRSIALSKGLVKNGHEVDFFTIPLSETHVDSKINEEYSGINVIYSDNSDIYDNLVKNNKKKKIKSFLISSMRKIYHSFAVYDYTKTIADKVSLKNLTSNNYDFLISISDPKTSHLAAKRLLNQGLKVKKWIQYWGDPLALDITKKNILPKRLLLNVERKILSNCDQIVYSSPITLKQQMITFPSLSKVMSFVPTPFVEEKIYKKTNNTIFKIGYFGAYTKKIRNILPLYQAVEELGSTVDFTIVGNTDLKLIEKKNIHIFKRQNILKYEEQMDLLVCMLNSKGGQIPGKVFHYAATNKPILLILDGEYSEEISQYFSKFERYYICYNNKDEIKNKLNEIKNENEKKDITYRPVKEFQASEVAKEFLRDCLI